MVIKVNGVRIAARGGNWGMDDSRKRVSVEHLEPYFRLHRDANVNMICIVFKGRDSARPVTASSASAASNS